MNFIRELYEGLNKSPNGKFSHTRFWSNVAYCTATFIMLKLTYTSQLTPDYLLIYMATVASHASVSKYIGSKSPQTKEKEATE